MTADTNIVITPKTLGAALDFLAKLYKLGVTDQVDKALEDKVNWAINLLTPEKVHLHVPLTEDIFTNLNEVLPAANTVRNVIVKKGVNTDVTKIPLSKML